MTILTPLLTCLATAVSIASLLGSGLHAASNQYEKINEQKHRLVILADMGNEEDEKQQMMHLLMYANEFDLEGLLAVSGKFLHEGRFDKPHYKHSLHPEIFHELIDAYEEIEANLHKHAHGYPTADFLRSIVKSGTPIYGMKGVGKGMSNEGSKWLLHVLQKDDPRPVYIVGNAGTNVLAQALIDFRSSHSEEELNTLLKKLIVYENGSQDDAGGWIMHTFPSIHWIRSNFQTYGYMGYKKYGMPGPYIWQPYPETPQGQHEWARDNIQTNHGPLGAEYPDRFKGTMFLEGGGTTPWLGLISRGLNYPYEPQWGGWGGRYSADKVEGEWSRHAEIAEKEKAYGSFKVFADVSDTWTDPISGTTFNDNLTPIHRWRKDILDDFKARMDWCVEEPENANHNPVAVIDGIQERVVLRMEAKAGSSVAFDGSLSYDRDKGQDVSHKWWIYPESGTYEGDVKIPNPNASKITLQIPSDASGKEIHLILEVADDSNIVVMKDYKRVVIEVE